jgi:hypothetical protein
VTIILYHNVSCPFLFPDHSSSHHVIVQHNHQPLEWRGSLLGGSYFWFSHDAFLAHIAAIAVTNYVVYSPYKGCWVTTQIYGREYCPLGGFLIYWPYHTSDEECPNISYIMHELHLQMMNTLPEIPLAHIPRCYMHILGSCSGCADGELSAAEDSDCE